MSRVETAIKIWYHEMMKKILIIGGIIAFFVIGFYLISRTGVNENIPSQNESSKIQTEQPPMQQKMIIKTNKAYTAILHTSQGDIGINLDVKTRPVTVNNFVTLAQKNFYNNTIFHRVIKGFMIQGGDPKGDGTGGPDSYVVEAPAANTKYARGVVAMAKKGSDPAGTSGSQFFIMQEDNTLPPDYAVLGTVVSGMDVVDAIANAPVASSGFGEMSKPVTPVSVSSVEVVIK